MSIILFNPHELYATMYYDLYLAKTNKQKT